MNRADFMMKLEALLADMPKAEREEALQYYNDYFDDAGSENEQEVISALGTPESVAASIKQGAAGEGGAFTENGYADFSAETANSLSNPGTFANCEHGEKDDKETTKQKKKCKLSTSQIILIVIACILLSPFLLGGLGAMIGVFFAILGVLIALVVSGCAIVFVLLAGTVALFGAGIGLCIASSPLLGGCLIGISFIMAALFILALWLMVAAFVVFVPGIIRLVRSLWKRIFHKGGKKA